MIYRLLTVTDTKSNLLGDSMKHVVASLLFVLVAGSISMAEIRVKEVVNNTAVIEFDKEDQINLSSKLEMTKLSLGSAKNITQCETCQVATKTEYIRRHLVGVSLSSTSTDETAQSGTAYASSDVSTIRLNADYDYNYINYALGGGIRTLIQNSSNITSRANSVLIGAKFFFVPNQQGTKIIPYAGAYLSGYALQMTGSPEITGSLSGLALQFGAMFYATDSAFFNVRYSSESANGKISQVSSVDYRIRQQGISVGVGMALQ